MNILVFSDSHSSLRFMRDAMERVNPDAVIHLGDHYDDGETIGEEYPQVSFYQVPGNCDRYRCSSLIPEILCCRVCGIDLYMTHGHLHKVKQTLSMLLADSKAAKVQAVLYGHTHIADCHREEDLWVLNPGTCGHFGGSAGVIETDGEEITACRIIRQTDLEEFV